jgi:hypothetical protein
VSSTSTKLASSAASFHFRTASWSSNTHCAIKLTPNTTPAVEWGNFSLNLKSTSQLPVVHPCNPSYLGGWDWKDCGSSPDQENSLRDLIFKITRAKLAGGVAQVVGHLLCKHEVLGSNPSPTRKKCKRKSTSSLYSHVDSCVSSSPLLHRQQWSTKADTNHISYYTSLHLIIISVPFNLPLWILKISFERRATHSLPSIFRNSVSFMVNGVPDLTRM